MFRPHARALHCAWVRRRRTSSLGQCPTPAGTGYGARLKRGLPHTGSAIGTVSWMPLTPRKVQLTSMKGQNDRMKGYRQQAPYPIEDGNWNCSLCLTSHRFLVAFDITLRRQCSGGGCIAFQNPLEAYSDDCTQHRADNIDPRGHQISADQVGGE